MYKKKKLGADAARQNHAHGSTSVVSFLRALKRGSNPDAGHTLAPRTVPVGCKSAPAVYTARYSMRVKVAPVIAELFRR